MHDLLPFIIGGLVTGSVYGLAGVGLVLTYKTSGIFNFAHGSLSTVSAFIFYTLYDQHHLAWPLAAIIALIVAGPVLGLLLELVARTLGPAPLAVQVVGTVGLLLIVESAVLLIYGTTTSRTVKQFLPSGGFHFDGTSITVADVLTFGVALVATVGLYVYFRTARTGVAMRAVVDDPALLGLAGTSPVGVRRRAWIIGVTFAAMSGILVAPLLAAIDGTTLTLLVVTAFGAAAIGSFTNLPLTYIGGLAIGLAGSLTTKYFTYGIWAELPSALPFVILFVVLLVAPRRRLVTRTAALARARSTWRAPARLQFGGGGLILVFLLFVPSFAGIHLGDWTTFLADVVLFLSLGLLVRTSGQVSLCHVTFLALGASVFSHLVVEHHVPWLIALLLAGLVSVPVGAVLAIPAIRLTGLYLALASLGFGILASYMFYGEGFMFGITTSLTVPRPDVSWLHVSSDKGYYYLVLAFAAGTTALVVGLNRSRLGRLLRGLSASPTGLATSGASVNVTRVMVFCLSAFLASVAGVLGGGVIGVISSASYAPLLSVTFFAVVVISVGGEPWYALLAAVGLAIAPSYIHGATVNDYLTLLFGFGALGYAVTPDDRRGAPVAVRRLLDRLGGRSFDPSLIVVGPDEAAPEVPPARPVRVDPPGAAGAAPVPVTAEGGLQVADLRVRFGGLVAVDGVSLRAPLGRITGLIGPNGAGKTTTFDACSGLNRPTSGRVLIDGRNVSKYGPARRARLGLGRTFQQMQLFDTLSVRENVGLGREGGFAGPNPLAHVFSPARERRAVAEATAETLALCDLEAIADLPVGLLSTGQRRLVDLARCLAGRAHFMLLDEPSSGLDGVETARFGRILTRVVRTRGVGILLVEHDMSLVTAVCDEIFVLDFGQMIFSGTPTEVMQSATVRSAYLGSELPGSHDADADPGAAGSVPGVEVPIGGRE